MDTERFWEMMEMMVEDCENIDSIERSLYLFYLTFTFLLKHLSSWKPWFSKSVPHALGSVVKYLLKMELLPEIQNFSIQAINKSISATHQKIEDLKCQIKEMYEENETLRLEVERKLKSSKPGEHADLPLVLFNSRLL